MSLGTPRIGLALSGGGARAACEVGMLRALDEANIQPHVMAGTSAGAVIGLWHALNPGQIDRLEAIWLSLRTRDIFPGNRLRMLSNFIRHGYVHAALVWERFLRRHFAEARFEDLSIPCAVVAVDLHQGALRIFNQGEIVPAVMASTAIPGVFPPATIDGRQYVDGGLLEYLPVSPLLDQGAEIIYAFDCSYLEATVGRGLAVMDRCDRISARSEVDATAARLTAQGVEMRLLRPPLPDITDPRSFSESAAFIRAGYDFASAYVAEIKSSEGSFAVPAAKSH